METNSLSVRELQQSDIPLIINYWLSAGDAFLANMGVDLSKMPQREEWMVMLSKQLNQSYKEKQSYCITWLANDEPVGHSNVNKIIFGEEAYMHLHLWQTNKRKKGMGAALVKMSLPYFFNNLQIKKIYCEPHSLNAAPNKTMEKIGFTFIKEHTSIPGSFSFEQLAKLWEMTYEDYKKLA